MPDNGSSGMTSRNVGFGGFSGKCLATILKHCNPFPNLSNAMLFGYRKFGVKAAGIKAVI